VDVLGLEVGYRLIPMVDKGQDGELLKRIRGLRKKFAQEVGFLPRRCTSATTSSSSPTPTASRSRASRSAAARPIPGQFLAINPGRVSGPLRGARPPTRPSACPRCGSTPAMREQAHALGYTVVDASTVVATHLNHVILNHAAELLGRQETQALLDHVGKETPKLVEDLVPKLLPLGHRAARAAEPARRGRQYPRHASPLARRARLPPRGRFGSLGTAARN
jgi:flagellar biosynthesis protein FlhA